MAYATWRKLLIIVSSVAGLSGGLGLDAAYARGGGGFDRGGGGITHMEVGFGGGHMVGDVEADHIGGFGEIGGGFAGLRRCRNSCRDTWGRSLPLGSGRSPLLSPSPLIPR